MAEQHNVQRLDNRHRGRTDEGISELAVIRDELAKIKEIVSSAKHPERTPRLSVPDSLATVALKYTPKSKPEDAKLIQEFSYPRLK